MKRLIFSLLLLIPATAHAGYVTYDWTGKAKESGWKVAVGDTIKGILRIKDDADVDADLGDGKVYSSAFITIQAGGEEFESAVNCSWFVTGTTQGVGTEIVKSGVGDVSELDWYVGGENPSYSLANAAQLDKTWCFGGWGMVMNNGEDATEFNGSIDSITRRFDVADANPVPELPSGALTGIALALWMFVYGRKRLHT